MAINSIFTKIFKVDRENNISGEEKFDNQENVNNYIFELLQKLADEPR